MRSTPLTILALVVIEALISTVAVVAILRHALVNMRLPKPFGTFRVGRTSASR